MKTVLCKYISKYRTTTNQCKMSAATMFAYASRKSGWQPTFCNFLHFSCREIERGIGAVPIYFVKRSALSGQIESHGGTVSRYHAGHRDNAWQFEFTCNYLWLSGHVTVGKAIKVPPYRFSPFFFNLLGSPGRSPSLHELCSQNLSPSLSLCFSLLTCV